MFKFLIVILVAVVPLSFVTGQVANDDEVLFSVRYLNKEVYYPHSDVMLRVSIKNNSATDYIFELADEALFNIDVKVRTLTNLALPPSDTFIRRTRSNETRPVLYRLINLRSGEEHSFTINLHDFVQISEANTYIIQTTFRPRATLNSENLAINASQSNVLLRANPLRLNVRPFLAERTFTDLINQRTGEILQQQNLSPDEIIRYTLEARQAEEWNKVFLYMNMEELFRRNADRANRFSFADVAMRAQMLEDFRTELMATTTEADLSTIPYQFDILSTFYTNDAAVVIARQVYRQRQFNEVREFRWHLRRDGDSGIWQIYDYEVNNLGTERL